VDQAVQRLAAEKEKEKKDAEKARARERMRAREALEKRRRRQARDGLPLEPSPETLEDNDDDDDDDEDNDMVARLGLSSDLRLGQEVGWHHQCLGLGLGKKPVTRNPNPEYPNPNPKYPKPKFCSGISGSNLQNPKLFRVIRVSQSGTRNTRITRTFMCHVLMSCLIINLYIYNYV
jgi:hypothetical protein